MLSLWTDGQFGSTFSGFVLLLPMEHYKIVYLSKVLEDSLIQTDGQVEWFCFSFLILLKKKQTCFWHKLLVYEMFRIGNG